MIAILLVLLNYTGVADRFYWRPDPKPAAMDAVAPECRAADHACIADHDWRALSMALLARDRDWCSAASRVLPCLDAYDMIMGDWVPRAPHQVAPQAAK